MIEDLVTKNIGTLSANRLPKSALKALEWKKEVTQEDFLLQVKRAQQKVKNGDNVWQEVSLVIAIAERNYFPEAEVGNIKLLLLAYEAEQGSLRSQNKIISELKEVERWTKEDIYENQKRQTLCDVFACIDFISELLGEAAPGALAKATCCKRETANRWIQGKSAPRYLREVFRLAGALYDARAEGQSEQALLKIASSF